MDCASSLSKSGCRGQVERALYRRMSQPSTVLGAASLRSGASGTRRSSIGELVIKYSGTLERYAGDGVMVIFNDPMPGASGNSSVPWT